MDKKGKEYIKDEYVSLSKKYNLPDFYEITKDFDIFKIEEKESFYLLREIRRIMNDKFLAYLHLFDNFINPSSAPVFLFQSIKLLDESDKENIKDIYKQISKIQIQSLKLDTIYDEESEAKFIREYFNFWQGIKKDIYNFIDKIEKNMDFSSSSKIFDYFS